MVKNKDSKTGAVFGKNISNRFKQVSEAVRYSQMMMKKGVAKQEKVLPYQGVFFHSKMLKQS